MQGFAAGAFTVKVAQAWRGGIPGITIFAQLVMVDPGVAVGGMTNSISI